MGDEPTSMKAASPEQEVFAEALRRATPEARAAYLDAACGATPLRRRVEALLRAAENAGDFLEQPPDGLSGDAESSWLASEFNEKPGDRIGRYKLLEKIGEGGCGTVYMAEQEEPVRRRVALKVIKLGMDTRTVVARFEAERQALALMDHPNIARVFDGGATRTGRPYFVMELVRGVPITTFCEQENLPTVARLRLFILVCQAVQHAHQKGIIHRDLKPSNILVTVNDGAPVPKVIDFGIAKATGQRLTDKTLFTQFHLFIGTPAYISPEQAEMSSVDVDTRSDIYSLGVLLYELLTGRTPFDGEELLHSGLEEMRRTIRDKEPVKPSTRMTQELAERKSTSRNAESIHLVRGDLDSIVMKCLEKDRSRRYETANGLAADIQRHLSHEPIQARPVNALGKLRRWRRRHPAVAVLSASVLVLLVLLAIGSTVSAWRIASARTAEHEERTLAESANRELAASNERLAATVNLLELQRVDDLLQVNDSPGAVARLTALLRRNHSNQVAVNRLISALIHRNWALPVGGPIRHGDRVVSARFSGDGRRVLSASWDKTAVIRDSSTGSTIATLQHEDRLASAQYSPDGTRILTATAAGVVRIWNALDGVLLRSLNNSNVKLISPEFSPDGLSVLTLCPAAHTVRIWDLASGALRSELGGRDSEVQLARFSPDGERVAALSQGGFVVIWAVNSGKPIVRFDALSRTITVLAFSPDGRRLASADQNGTARLWSANTGEAASGPLRHDNVVSFAVFSPDSQVLLTGSQDNSARFWNVTNGQMIGGPLLHEGGVVFGAFSADGRMAVTTSMDNSARLWEVRTGRTLCQPLRHLEAVLHASFSPDGRRLVTSSWDATMQLWNIAPRSGRGFSVPHQDRITSVAFDPGGESVLSGSIDQSARLWNAHTGVPLVPPMRHGGAVCSVNYSPDGSRVLTASEDSTAQLWDSATGLPSAPPLRHAKTVCLAVFSPDGLRVATASQDGSALIWDARTGKGLISRIEHGAPVNSAQFSPDGEWLVTASENNSARVWNSRTGQPISGKLQHLDHVEWADFSPDGQRVVSASSDNTAQVWNVRTGEPIGPSLQHGRTVQKAVFSPDGRRVATASLDHTARVWDATTGEPLTPAFRHPQSVSQVCFSPDGECILTACWSVVSRLWNVSAGCPTTEWLDAGGPGFTACFDRTGRRVVAGSFSSSVIIWNVPRAPTPIPGWFLDFAESVGGESLSARGNLALVSREALEKTAQRLAIIPQADFYERLARWFLAEPSQRGVSPLGNFDN
jgi:WD40 repeat protein/serine/threonine protein kinase